MSIVASVKVYDGIVLGADSKTQIIAKNQKGEVGFVKAYNHAQKLFEVKGIEKMSAGILTYGVGNIGTRSVESYIIDFTDKLSGTEKENKPSDLKNLTEKLLAFLKQAYSEQYPQTPEEKLPKLGVLLAGHSQSSALGEEWEFTIPNKDSVIKQVRDKSQLGASWRGVTVPFTRLYKGFDPRLITTLKKQGIKDDYLEIINDVMKGFTWKIAFEGMPLQDAIDFCRFILSATVNMAHFEIGVPSCGQPLDIAVITRTEGFKWIKKKEFK